MGLYDYTIYDMICRNEAIYPDHEAFIFDGVRLNYRDYKRKCDQLAAGLSKEGLKKGDRLGVIAHNCDEYMIIFGAAAKIGAIVLPVNWRLKQPEVEYVLNECTPKIVFAGKDFQKVVEDISVKVTSIEKCYSIGTGESNNGFLPLRSLYDEEGAETCFDIPADTGFVIIQTASVEGKPRGALLSQANIIATNIQMTDLNRIEKDHCHICILPLFHIAALSMTMATMYKGAKNVILEHFDPELTLKLIEREKGTFFATFSPILKTLIDKYEEGAYEFDIN